VGVLIGAALTSALLVVGGGGDPPQPRVAKTARFALKKLASAKDFIGIARRA
jgi:hypothetical protein